MMLSMHHKLVVDMIYDNQHIGGDLEAISMQR